MTDSFRQSGIGVTVEQFAVLAMLYYQNGINQQEISAQLDRDKTTIARVISIMEKNGWIRREMDKGDRRGKVILLTAKGRALQQRAVEVSGKLYMNAMNGVSHAELKMALALMDKISSNVFADKF